jgi:hypothetical protein
VNVVMVASAQALVVPAIVTAVGGVGEQASAREVVVQDDRGLRGAMSWLRTPGGVAR